METDSLNSEQPPLAGTRSGDIIRLEGDPTEYKDLGESVEEPGQLRIAPNIKHGALKARKIPVEQVSDEQQPELPEPRFGETVTLSGDHGESEHRFLGSPPGKEDEVVVSSTDKNWTLSVKPMPKQEFRERLVQGISASGEDRDSNVANEGWLPFDKPKKAEHITAEGGQGDITIIGTYGKAEDGREYLRAAEFASGVPADEVRYINESAQPEYEQNIAELSEAKLVEMALTLQEEIAHEVAKEEQRQKSVGAVSIDDKNLYHQIDQYEERLRRQLINKYSLSGEDRQDLYALVQRPKNRLEAMLQPTSSPEQALTPDAAEPQAEEAAHPPVEPAQTDELFSGGGVEAATAPTANTEQVLVEGARQAMDKLRESQAASVTESKDDQRYNKIPKWVKARWNQLRAFAEKKKISDKTLKVALIGSLVTFMAMEPEADGPAFWGTVLAGSYYGASWAIKKIIRQG